MTHEYVSSTVVTAWPQVKDGAEGYGVKYDSGFTSWSPKAIFEAATISIGHIAQLPPYQQRVLAEEAQLNQRITDLKAFLSMPTIVLPAIDVELLTKQLEFMVGYSDVLAARIREFGGISHDRREIKLKQAGDNTELLEQIKDLNTDKRDVFLASFPIAPEPIVLNRELKTEQFNAMFVTDPDGDSTDSLRNILITAVYDSVGNTLPLTLKKVDGTPNFLPRFFITGPEFDAYIEADLQRGTVTVTCNQVAPGFVAEWAIERVNENRRPA